MASIISILIIIVCILLILIVLIQNSKGGGLASSFSSSNQVMGVRKTGDFLEKATWTLAASLLVLCVLSTSFTKTGEGTTTGGTTSTTRGMAGSAETPAMNTTTAKPAGTNGTTPPAQTPGVPPVK